MRACRQAIIMKMEQYGVKNPLGSIYKLNKVVGKAGSQENITWAVELMYDLWMSGSLKDDQMALRHLEGKIKGSNGKGTVDLLILKKDLQSYILDHWMDKCAWSAAQKATIRDVCRSIVKFRESCGYVFNAGFKRVRPYAPHAVS